MSELPTLAEIPVSTLAWIGDAVYELYARTRVLGDGRLQSGRLHQAAVRYSSAVHQAAAVEKLLPLLTEEESGIFRRGRNHAPSSSPRNAPPQAYRLASGLEALVGYLYLADRRARLEELLDIILSEGDA
ncbi:MAG: ribonuclease III domain-containing protein [Bacillota bacterium]|nr:ribonuclease III domain-containing protein [Bacillota bacterium]